MVRIERDIENESCSTLWVDPKTVFEPHIEPKNSPLGPQKVKNNHKIKLKSNVRIEGNKENKSICTIWVDQKHFEPDPNPKNSLFFAQQSQKKLPISIYKARLCVCACVPIKF